jgi:dihydrofolate reductase
MIAAVSENSVIGRDNRLPWHMPADLEYFRRVTAGKPFIMGRTSYLSEDVLLSDRLSVILSHDSDVSLKKNCAAAGSIPEALSILKDYPEIFILGGASVYRQFLPVAGTIYLTLIHAELKGDAFFPALDSGDWILMESIFHSRDVANPYDYSFKLYRRNPLTARDNR